MVQNTKGELMEWIRDWVKQHQVFSIGDLSHAARTHFEQDPTWVQRFFEQQLDALIKDIGREVIRATRPDLIRVANQYLSRDLVKVAAPVAVEIAWGDMVVATKGEYVRLLSMTKDDLRRSAQMHLNQARANLIRALFYKKIEQGMPPGTTVGQCYNADDLNRLAAEAVAEAPIESK